MAKIVLLLIVAVVASLLCAKVIDTAVVRPKEFVEVLRDELYDADTDQARISRSVEFEEGSKTHHNCQGNPCGWAIYTKYTRKVTYFMKNSCVCPDSSYKCIRTDDDLSASAYVFHCRQNTTASDTEAPEEDTKFFPPHIGN